MEKNFYAHINENGKKQTVREHLEGTAALCAEFAGSFGASEQGYIIGITHDIGKCSTEFQDRLNGGHIVDHSSAGSLECARRNAEWAACCVAGHHGGLPDVGNLNNDSAGDPTLYGRLKKAWEKKIPDYEMPVHVSDDISKPQNYGVDRLTDSFIIRMLYSCLVDADYLDTEAFMSEQTVKFKCGDGILSLLDKLNSYIAPWWEPKGDLNRLRCDILKKCIETGREPKGFFSLTVPTGGGKTVSSVAFALNHAAAHNMEHIIYVIPFTSIIEQTADVFRKIFGDENVVEHHSNLSYEVKEGENEDSVQYRMTKAVENWDSPIIVTTAVQFFESVYSNRPSKCRKLHNISNSVIIFDEAQMLPTEHLRPCVAAIAKLVKDFASTAVLCTATQPFLNDLIIKYSSINDVHEICPNTSELFSKFKRVTFNNAGRLDIDILSQKLSAHEQVLCIVNSRKSAQEIYKKLPKEGSFHLSTLMFPAHRKEVLDKIRKRLVSGLPCRVVSTSLIEAGVDIDFPSVYREMAGLDSILQAAGRCNREGKHSTFDSVVTIFEGVSTVPPVLKINIGAAKEVLTDDADLSDPDTVDNYFKAYRSLSGVRLDSVGVIEAFENGINGCTFPFKTVAERFHLIGDTTKTVYIPIGEGEELINRIRSGIVTRDIFRKLNQYSVSIYEKQYSLLEGKGALLPLYEDDSFLCDTRLYDPALGLVINEEEAAGLFI